MQSLPGPDLIKLILRKHTEQTNKFAPKIKKFRANVNEEILKDYIQHLTITIPNISPGNINIYDKKNLSDDPGSETCLVKRGK